MWATWSVSSFDSDVNSRRSASILCSLQNNLETVTSSSLKDSATSVCVSSTLRPSASAIDRDFNRCVARCSSRASIGTIPASWATARLAIAANHSNTTSLTSGDLRTCSVE